MNTHFIAFLNKHGIACASDTDMTLYALSKQEPVALAVNPYSPIPWDSIINAYLRRGDIPLHDDFADYAHDFIQYLTTIESKKKWAKLTEDEASIIFLGFGQNDLFPSGVHVCVSHNEESNTLKRQYFEKRSISHHQKAEHCILGDFEFMQPMLYGISDTAMKSLIDRQVEDLKKYKDRMAKALKKAHCNISLDDFLYDDSNPYIGKMSNLYDFQDERLSTAIGSFNIEDMVKAVETFIDANDQLEHLQGGGIGDPKNTKELAVITRTEGVVWIKHCLFGI